MKNTRSIGRLIGLLLIVQLIALAAGFMMLMPGVGTDYLNVAAAMSVTIRTASLLLLAAAVITLGISGAAYPVFKEYSLRLAIWLVAVSIVWVVIQSVDNAHILSMLSLSTRFAEGAGSNAEIYNLLSAQARAARGWMHYTQLLVTDAWFALLYAILFKFRLIPRLLAAFGLLAIVLHAIGIPLSAFVGYRIIWALAYGLPISSLLVGGWLIAKGFPNRDEPAAIG